MFKYLSRKPTFVKSLNAQFCSTKYPSNYYGGLQQFTFHENEFKPLTPLQQFIDKYRQYGHYFAKVDPLNLNNPKDEFPSALDLGIRYDQSLDNVNETLEKLGSVENIEKFLKAAYTNGVGIEFGHIINHEERQWLYNEYESLMARDLTMSEKSNILTLLTMSETFDHFLQRKFETFKRYSGEGSESLLVALNTIFARASEKDISDIVLGMPHRGRFNILVGLLEYPARDLFHKISGKNDLPEELSTVTDDVASHVAVSNKKTYRTGSGRNEKDITVTMLHNPSHLEAVNPVSMGKTRAKQEDSNDQPGNKIFNIQIHGDAAFSGQGVVYESFAMSKLPNFGINGTIHIICNNQIGFTTTPLNGRSSKYASDICKTYDIPVIHVNADHPEEVQKIAKLAVEYRQKFKKDIMIDLIGYRRYGHNEVDEPEFTQPHMYKQIREKQITAPKKYFQYLESINIVKPNEFDKLKERFNKFLEAEYQAKNQVNKTLDQITNEKSKGSKAFTGKWKNLVISQYGQELSTGIDAQASKQLAYASIFLPPNFTPHPRIHKYHIQARQQQIEKNSFDWATAEAIAFASLLNQGFNVRLSGQDVERGTFSHRHLVLTDLKTEQKWTPLKEYSEGFNPNGRFYIANSLLSETAVLSYEYGYSLESPRNMVIWEAQFGDFFNTAQVPIDTFVTSSEAKWLRQTGMVMLLPHGYDGAGPEHSTCRIERFLQLGSTDGIDRNLKYKEHDTMRKESQIGEPYFYANHQDINFQFINPTTPANYYHALRRQMMRNFRKPLIVASPKILLKHPMARSTFEDISAESAFLPVLTHTKDGKLHDGIDTIFVCSGKIQYEIKNILKEDAGLHERSALFILEELLPFPEKTLQEYFAKLSKKSKVIWIQEEPYNGGAFLYAEPHISRIMEEVGFNTNKIICHARRSIATTATGVVEKHSKEYKALFNCIRQYKT